MERSCPDALLLNVSTPLTALCRAVTRETSITTVGLCNELVGLTWAMSLLFWVATALACEGPGAEALIEKAQWLGFAGLALNLSLAGLGLWVARQRQRTQADPFPLAWRRILRRRGDGQRDRGGRDLLDVRQQPIDERIAADVDRGDGGTKGGIGGVVVESCE